MAITHLTEEQLESYQGACIYAQQYADELTPFLSLLKPCYDDTPGHTAKIDKHFRVALGEEFFKLPREQRGTIVVHEVFHPIYDNFNSPLDRKRVNLAEDLVINQGIRANRDLELPGDAVSPYDHGLKDGECFNWYYKELGQNQPPQGGGGQQPPQGGQGQGQGQGGNGPGQPGDGDGEDDENGQGDNQQDPNGNGQGPGCPNDMAGEDTEAEMDAAGIEKNTELEKANATEEARAKAASKSKGNTGTNFTSFVLDALVPPKLNWRSMLAGVLSTAYNTIIAGREDFSYRRPNRRRCDGEILFPGTVGYEPTVAVGIDTSGSMGHDDWEFTLSEISGLIKQMNCKPRFITIDTEVTGMKETHDPTKIDLRGGGGTEMHKFYVYLEESKEAYPDITVLCTDGWIDWDDVEANLRRKAKNIILSTRDKETEISGATVIPLEMEERL